MAVAALRKCVQPGCPLLVERGRCSRHTVTERHRPNVDVRRWYRTAQWARLRQRKLDEEPFCVDCDAEGRLEVWTDLDHEVPHRGDPVLFWDYTNLRGRCHAHHAAKTARGL